MLNNVSLILGVVAGFATLGGGLLMIGIRIGSFDSKFVNKREYLEKMEKIEVDRIACRSDCDYNTKNINTGMASIPSAFVNKADFEKHEKENKESNKQINDKLNEILEKMDSFLSTTHTDVALIKQKVGI